MRIEGRRRMYLPLALAVALLFRCAVTAGAQAGPAGGGEPFRLKLPVNEVVLTFHAADEHGLPVNDLKLDEVRVLDNGHDPRRTVAFDSLLDRPVRAGIMLDTSESMQRALARSKAIAEQFAGKLFRQSSDQAFVMDFGFSSEMAQVWTPEPARITRAIRNVKLKGMNPLEGTDIFGTIFRACFYGFDKANPTVTGNFLLLFSDGEDNAGQVTMEEALGACQSSNVAIYAFRVRSDNVDSTGPRTLARLAEKTGGRVFDANESGQAVWDDLKTIEGEMRNQYRLVYVPAELKPDGSFHRIELQFPDRVKRFEVRTGYYAPGQ